MISRIDIKDISENILLSVSISEGCERVEELMKADYVQLSWNSDCCTVFPVGSYIEYKGERFSLLDPYTPEQKDELEFTYTPQFQSRIMSWGKIPFFMYTYTDDVITNREPDWSLTDNPGNFMKAVCDAIKNETGETWTYAVDASLPASATLSFQSKDIFSALNEITNAFETEWWIDKTNKIIHLSKASHGTPVVLEVGGNVNAPSVTEGKEGYYTRFYAYGSTRNIAQDYKGSNTNNLVNKRLTLDPVKYPNGYKDVRPDLKDGEIFSKVLIFDEIYPSSKLAISDVRSRLMYRLDEKSNKIQVGTDDNGNPIYDQYAIWYFQIPGYTFDEENRIESKNISVHFETGSLAGREFELIYHNAAKKETSSDGLAFQVKAGDFEIKFVEENSLILPMMTGLVPVDTDKVILFNVRMPEEYTASAYVDLEAALDKEIEHLSSDLNNYQFSSNPVSFYDSNPNLSIGQNVTYKNGTYSYSTRVIKLVTKIDYENDCNQTITIGNEKVKGNTQELKEEVASANKDLNLLAVFNDMTASLQQSYSRTQQMMLDGFAAIKNIWQLKEDDYGNKYALSKYSVVTEGGITMRYADPLRLPTLMESLVLDESTLALVDGKLTVIGGTGGGLDETELANYLTEHNYYHSGNANKSNVDWTGAIVKANTGFRSDSYKTLDGSLNMIQILNNNVYLGNRIQPTTIASNNSNLEHDKNGAFYTVWDASNANLSGVDWATYSLRSYHHIEVNSGIDTKLIFNNTDGEKYTAISFRENGSQYASITADGRSNGTITLSGLPVRVSRLNFATASIDDNGNLGIGMTTVGGNARGQFYHSGTYSGTRLGGIGCYSLNGALGHFYIGWDDTPWYPVNSFSVNKTDVRYKNNIIWHAGNMGAGSGLNADMLDGYHRSSLFPGGLVDFLKYGTNDNCYKTFEVTGDKDTYYPVVINVSNNDNYIDNIITISKSLGSKTPAWAGNHENGTSSGIFSFHYRIGVWDGNGKFLNTIRREMPYANWVGHMEFAYSSVGKAVVWLRGGGATYTLLCNNSIANINIYYTRTNIYGNDTYPAWVEPRTSGNYGFYATGAANPCFTTVYLNNSDNYINNEGFKLGLFKAVGQDFKIRDKDVLSAATDRLYINYADSIPVQINGITTFTSNTVHQSAAFIYDRLNIGNNDFWSTPKLSIHGNYPLGFYHSGGTANKRRYYFSLGASSFAFSSLNDGNSWVRTLYEIDHDGRFNLYGNGVLRFGNSSGYIHNTNNNQVFAATSSDYVFCGGQQIQKIYLETNGGYAQTIEGLQTTFGGNLLVRGKITMKYTSDRRLKENLKRFDAHSLITKLGGVYEYDYTDEAIRLNSGLPRHSIGLIAQKVERYFPFMVNEDGNGYKGINYIDPQFISLLAASELQTIGKLKILEKRQTKEEKEIQRLKARISELERLVSPKAKITNIL